MKERKINDMKELKTTRVDWESERKYEWKKEKY
jgi:hypothetical protein